MDAIISWLGSTTHFFQAQWDFMDSGIYDFIKSLMVVLTKASIWSAIQLKIMMIDVAYEVVQEVITDSGAAQLVSSAWASIPGDIQSTLSFFKIPQGLSLLFSAIPTRWAMRFIPGA
ncbi:DUF2523 family protein [Pseudomonas huanghezhanensis]|uniref:DUF2523 family protein n=1 Tax=Pseudomonas huanghezhanensis TaxID=3002903 RepID=UPI002286CD96|nr:DUF2523 family protein [Pseudomonas sp. BSw22131]